MLDSEVFTAGLDTVIEALQRRAVAGGELKASAAALDELCVFQAAQVPRPPALAADKKVSDSPSVPAPRTSATAPPSPAAQHSATAQHTPAAQHRVTALQADAKVSKPALFVFPTITPSEDGATREEKLLALREAVLPCALCAHLAATRRHVIFGEGAVDAALMFVAEAPGVDEDKEGRPFAGEAGALLDKMLLAMGLSRPQVYLTSVLKCRPDTPAEETASRAPTIAELAQCAPYLASQISIIKPRVIVAMGAGAMRALFGSSETVGKLRSRWHDLQGIPVMPTFNPGYLMRNQSNTEKRKVWEDLLQVMERLGLDITEKQRGFFKPRTSA